MEIIRENQCTLKKSKIKGKKLNEYLRELNWSLSLFLAGGRILQKRAEREENDIRDSEKEKNLSGQQSEQIIELILLQHIYNYKFF